MGSAAERPTDPFELEGDDDARARAEDDGALNPFELEDDDPDASSPAAPARTPDPEAFALDDPADRRDPSRSDGCPVCISSMRTDAHVCVKCGYDRRLGIQSSRLVPTRVVKDEHGHEHRAVPCTGCGFDLTGLRTMTCPECGTHHRPRSAAESRRAAAARAAKDAYKTPAILLGCGVLASVGLGSVIGMPVPATLVLLGTFTVAAFIALIACQVIWIGFDAPLRLEVLRTAAFVSVGLSVRQLFWAVGIPILLIAEVVALVTYALLWAGPGDMDQEDALLMTAILVVVLLMLMFAGFAVG